MNPPDDRIAAVDPVSAVDAVGPEVSAGTSARPVWSDGSPMSGPPAWSAGATAPDAAPLTPRSITLAASTVVASILLAVASILPLPYAVTSPGPTRDTLGQQDGRDLIQVQGAPTYEPTGQLLLTTVQVAGGPGYPVGLVRVLEGWGRGADAVAPVESVFAPSETRDVIDERNQAAMISSQENATVAALEELGYVVPTTLLVADAMEGSGAYGVVEPDDVVLSIDGQAVASFSELSQRMDEVAPGDVVVVGVQRAGDPIDLEVTTTEGPDGRALLGVLIDPEFDLPIDVRIEIENVGGPSAGTMFALGIIDLLTEQDEANGLTIAGTGTMDLTGRVGPIGGIQQKLAGALEAGATWFLAPAANCGEVIGHVPDGLGVVRVATLSEARAALEAIGAGAGDTLPTCDDL